MEHKWMSILLPLLLLYNGRCAFIRAFPLEGRAGRHPRGGLGCPPKWGEGGRRGMPRRHRQQRPQHAKDALRIRKMLELSQMSDAPRMGCRQPPWDLAEGCEPCRLFLFPCPELHLGIPGPAGGAGGGSRRRSVTSTGPICSLAFRFFEKQNGL